MELAREVIDLNKKLADTYGIDTSTSKPIWRVSWSDDQYEMRHDTFVDFVPGTQIYLRTVTETRQVPKYKQWIHQKYILERLVVVPEQNLNELVGSKVSYENLWTFEDKNGNALPPKWEACQFIINTVLAAQYGNHSLARYKDPDDCQENQLENQRKRVDTIIEELFGEQSSLQGTTKTGESIIVPRNYEKVN